jgi:hypothetical protein
MSSFQDKMYNYEVPPPAKVWEQITAALYEPETVNEFPSKLYHHEAPPPVSAWEKIINTLDTEHAVVVQRRRKILLLYRYAGAAVIMGLIVFGTMKWLNNGSAKDVDQKVNITPLKESITPSNTENVASANINPAISDTAKDDVALENSKQTFAKLDASEKIRIAKIMTSPAKLIAASDPEENAQELNFADIMESSFDHIQKSNNFSDRYIVLMTPDGNIIRMSKKWGDMVCCVSGEEQDANCKNQLQKWREKIACSPLAPSSGNFLDILSLINSLKENNP